MRISFVLTLSLLAGCASAGAEPGPRPAPESRPVITRIVRADTPRIVTGDDAPLTAEKIERVDAPCRTGDRMPTAGLDGGSAVPMPSAQPQRALPYIPNLCPVIAAPEFKPAAPAVLQRTPKRVQP